MPRTPEQLKEAARRRKANQRARDKGLPEPHQDVAGTEGPTDEEKSARALEHMENLAWAQAQDATGKFYKSECRSAITLLGIYEGNNDVGLEEVDNIDQRTGKKRQNIPNPSVQAIRIRKTIADDGTKIEPDMFEYKSQFEINGKIGFRDWLDLRDRGRKDLFWLGRVMGKNLYHNTHQMICDMFVKKDFDGMYFPDFDQDDLHAMIGKQKRLALDGITPTRTLFVMAPRSGYKSTVDGLDASQWMLNCPDIRIMIITAFRRLAGTLMGEIKSYFYLPPRGTPSAFHLLFPEYILTGVAGRSKEDIRCPAQTLKSKEPHLWITSTESSATGLRCDIRKIDDAVDPKNSNNEEVRAKTAEVINGTNDLIEPWGFTDVVGTRYFTTDWYGTRMTPDESNQVAPFAYLHISAWTPKKEFEAQYHVLLETKDGMFQVKEHMVDLWFPQKLSFSWLRTLLVEKKERSFKNQQLNIATDPIEDTTNVVHFNLDGLRTHTFQSIAAPTEGKLVVTIDWAYSEKTTSDFSVLVASRIVTRKDGTQEVWVLEIKPEKWKSTELAEQIALFLRKWTPDTVIIEKALGADLLAEKIRVNCLRYGCIDVFNRMTWKTPSNEPNAKANRVKGLEILLADERLFFISGPWIDETYKQFCRFTGETKKGRKDDIPDAVSFITFCLSRATLSSTKVDVVEQKKMLEVERENALRQANYDRYFGQSYQTADRRRSDYTPWPPPQQDDGSGGMTPPPAPAPVDPRQKLFGRILPGGMRA